MRINFSILAAAVLAAAITGCAPPGCDFQFGFCFGESWRFASPALTSDVDVAARGGRGETPLHWAAAHSKNPAVIGALIKRGADIDAQDSDGATPLHWAARYGEGSPRIVGGYQSPPAIGALIDGGADINRRDNRDQTPLHWAAAASRGQRDILAIIDDLTDRGAEVNARDINGQTPLHWAAAHGRYPAVIGKLTDRGAEVNAGNASGHTPLHLAALINEDPAFIDELVKHGADVGVSAKYGVTPLHLAAANGKNPNVIMALLKHGADPAARGIGGLTPLNLARKNKALKDTPAIAALREAQNAIIPSWVLNATAFLRAAQEAQEDEDCNLYTGVCFGVNWRTVEAGGAAGVDVGAHATEFDFTPLHFAALHGSNPAVVKELIARGADVNARNSTGDTPLHTAVIVFPAVIKQQVTGDSADSGKRDDGVAYIGVVVYPKKNPAAIKAFAAGGADLGARNSKGLTPLHQAAALGGPAIVTELLTLGADAKARDGDGQFPLYYAEKNKLLKDTDALHALRAAHDQV